MTVQVTALRLGKTMQLLRRRAAKGGCAPSNDEIAQAIGMGQQSYQPWDRCRGFQRKSHEAGAVMVRALEHLGMISVERGRNWRRIILNETGQLLDKRRVVHHDGLPKQRIRV